MSDVITPDISTNLLRPSLYLLCNKLHEKHGNTSLIVYGDVHNYSREGGYCPLPDQN